MDTLSTTLTEEVDVVTNEPTNQEEEVSNEEEVQVESNDETTDTSDYEKAWDSIDTNNPSPELFGETTVTEEETPSVEDQHTEETPETLDVSTDGLVIKNPVLKYKGREIPIDNEEEAINLMQKGFKLESEMSRIKPYKSYISIIENGKVTVEQLKALDDALNGNDQAKNYLKTQLGIESTSEANTGFFDEVDDKPSVEEYKPDIPVQDPVAEFFTSLTEENPEVAGKVSQVYTELDDEFKLEVYQPNVFPLFAKSVADGEFEKLYPIAMKERISNPALTWLQAYQLAGKKAKTGKETRTVEVPSNATKISKSGTGRDVNHANDYDRAFEMSTEELEAKLFA